MTESRGSDHLTAQFTQHAPTGTTMRMTARVGRTTCFTFAATLKEACKVVLSAVLALLGFAILPPWARAQGSNVNPENLAMSGAYSIGPSAFNLRESGDDNVSASEFDNVCDPPGPSARPSSGKAATSAVATTTLTQRDIAIPNNHSELDSSGKPVEKKGERPETPYVDREIYYKNKIEFSLDGGWLPINIPFPFDVFEGDPYDLYPLRYTLVPIVASLRWHLSDVGGWRFLRGNWDLTAGGSATAIPKGAETHYFSYDMGIRRNFIPRNPRVSPYVDIRLGLGVINAKGPLGVYYAQGQNFTFTLNMGSGVRYNFNPRYAISGGLNWMHISNNNLSAPSYSNYGINVYGPMFGLNVTLGRHVGHSE